ncbi:hypothetical protein NPIL_581061 [Nephila pilipes]|uniref:Uncharacterized protein n=1 Tax=Nephila pilipes TaxID=299642 RepID=A0A8X6NWF6_NEPPI|nr:hypothetical protein NPIL_581061 [Nephila pilipes]
MMHDLKNYTAFSFALNESREIHDSEQKLPVVKHVFANVKEEMLDQVTFSKITHNVDVRNLLDEIAKRVELPNNPLINVMKGGMPAQ